MKFIEPSETSVCTVYTLTVHQKVQSRCWGVPVAIICVHIKTRVNKKMEEDPSSSHDFLSLVGMVSYYGSGDAA